MAPGKAVANVKVKKKGKSKSIKQRLRSIQRLLNKPDLPATVRVSQERMLEFMKSKLDEQQQFKKETKMIKKYKMVKFFEKRKLWRQHRSVMKELDDSSDPLRADELGQLQKKILQDMNYVEYFPNDRKYISLFPAQPYVNERVVSKQEELHRHINEKVDSGELPQASFKQSDKETKKKNKREKDYLERKKEMEFSNCDDEDDDFFIDTSGDQDNIK